MKARNPLFIHYVHDMPRARAFYEGVFGVEPRVAWPGWCELDFGTFTLALHIIEAGVPESPLPHAGLNLEVDEIESMQAVIEAAGGRMTELREATANIPDRVATFFGTEGNGFELRQHVGVTN